MPEIIYNTPNAKSLMETASSAGNYNLASALADLIDNSITANAKKISIDYDFDQEGYYVRIADNGSGMSKSELINAMQLAAKNPLDERDANDLGRFGQGLKTASFSQARRLIVLTKKKGEVSGAAYNQDDIEGFKMLGFNKKEVENMLLKNELFETTTEVIWRDLARLTEKGEVQPKDIYRMFAEAQNHLELVFHRFIGAKGKNKVQIYVNGNELKIIDPFFKKHPATWEMPVERVPINNENVTITPYILPHFSKLSPNQENELSGEEGYLKNQGFYVYRNKRLIIFGTWFKIIKYGELIKLARIQIDIGNSIDQEFRITLDKSNAQIPSKLRDRLKTLINKIKNSATRVYKQKAVKKRMSRIVQPWLRVTANREISYAVNMEHPDVENLLNKLNTDQQSNLKDVIKIVEAGLPLEQIYADGGADEDTVNQEATPEHIVELSEKMIARCREDGMTGEQIVLLLEKIEPYALYIDRIRSMV